MFNPKINSHQVLCCDPDATGFRICEFMQLCVSAQATLCHLSIDEAMCLIFLKLVGLYNK